jgi:hypothetical protein
VIDPDLTADAADFSGERLIQALRGYEWCAQPPANPVVLAGLSTEIGYALPSDYLAFLQWSDGGEALLPGGYLAIWPCEEIPRRNLDYEIKHWLPGLVLFGQEGDLAFAFDFRQLAEDPPVVSVELGALLPDDVVVMGTSLTDWIVEKHGQGRRLGE